MRVIVKIEESNERLSNFVIDRKNRHLFEKQGDVYLRKNRLSTVLYVDTYGRITKITGENPNENKVGQSIYK